MVGFPWEGMEGLMMSNYRRSEGQIMGEMRKVTPGSPEKTYELDVTEERLMIYPINGWR
jgi:hypothetical protein